MLQQQPLNLGVFSLKRMSADTSTISTPYIVFVWLFALVLFFAAVFSLAKSDTPGRDLISFFAFTSGWEGALLWGAISLLLHYADKSRDKVDEEDKKLEEGKQKESAGDV